MSRIFCFLLLSILVFATSQVTATSTEGVRVTPGNIDNHELSFQVRAVDVEGGKQISVHVQRKQDKSRPGLTARLTIQKGKTPLVQCPVAGENRKQDVVYELTVAAELLSHAKLTFEEIDHVQRNLPGGNVYWLLLQDFEGRSPRDKGAVEK